MTKEQERVKEMKKLVQGRRCYCKKKARMVFQLQDKNTDFLQTLYFCNRHGNEYRQTVLDQGVSHKLMNPTDGLVTND